jgi:hypothetical protein
MKNSQKYRGKWETLILVAIAVNFLLSATRSIGQTLNLYGTTELSADADVNGDGKTDFCQVKNQGGRRGQIVCLTAGFDAPRFTASDLFISPQIDLGYSTLPRGFADVNRDKRADFCRVAGFGTVDRMYLACNLAGSTGFGTDQYQFKSISGIDLGDANLPKGFADVNSDGKADFCRYVQTWEDYSFLGIGCNLAEANGFDAYFLFQPIVSNRSEDQKRSLMDLIVKRIVASLASNLD